MKKLLRTLRRQDGFTLVELMVVVAIIGLLSAVAIPNFKKYQARSKVTEAKLQLSALYTAEQAFFSDYNIYGHCLRYMGFDPAPEVLNRYYSVGFPAGLGNRDDGAHSAALNSGLRDDAAECPDSVAAVTSGTTNAIQWFAAGKGIGSSLISTAANAAANAAGTAIATCEIANIDSPNSEFGSCTGTQATNSTMVFQAAAVGIISAEAVTNATASGLNINQNKQIKNAVNGY